MIDNRGPFCRLSAIRGRKKIAANDFHILAGVELTERFLETVKLTGGPNETTNISKTVVKERLDYFASDKATRSGN
jgi:hypothetical protein